ncbi:hypothetical protein D3C74_388580 [compost metagenome]
MFKYGDGRRGHQTDLELFQPLIGFAKRSHQILNHIIDDFVEQVFFVLIMSVESTSIQIGALDNIRNRYFLKGMFLHQMDEGILQRSF